MARVKRGNHRVKRRKRVLAKAKGYFLAKIMYGKDRLTQPLLRMKDGKFDKNGEFTPITWDQALNSQEDLTPPKYEWGDVAIAPVAQPGKTKFV